MQVNPIKLRVGKKVHLKVETVGRERKIVKWYEVQDQLKAGGPVEQVVVDLLQSDAGLHQSCGC